MGYFQVIVIYDCKMFIRLAPEINHFDWIVQFKGLFYFIPLSTKSSDLNHRDISIDT